MTLGQQRLNAPPLIITEKCLGHCQLFTIQLQLYRNYSAGYSELMKPLLVIIHDQREGPDGCFQKSFEVKGGSFYRFKARRKTSGLNNLRQSCLVSTSSASSSVFNGL